MTETNEKIQRWVQLDNTIRQLRQQLKKAVDEKSVLEDDICVELPEEYEEILPDGKIKYTSKTRYESLTYKYLERILPTIITSTPEQCTAFIDKLKQKRSKIVEQCLVRVVENNDVEEEE